MGRSAPARGKFSAGHFPAAECQEASTTSREKSRFDKPKTVNPALPIWHTGAPSAMCPIKRTQSEKPFLLDTKTIELHPGGILTPLPRPTQQNLIHFVAFRGLKNIKGGVRPLNPSLTRQALASGGSLPTAFQSQQNTAFVSLGCCLFTLKYKA